MSTSTDWILACDGSDPAKPSGFVCERCGVKEPLPMRLPVDAYLAWAKGFLLRHKNCQPKSTEITP